jgi:hypothetical protein
MHLVGVHDGTNSRLYINGNQVATQTTGAVTQGLGDIYIGQLVASILPFDGSLDEVAIYPTALTPAQIAAHYAAQMWNPIPPIPWAVVCGSLPQFALSR